MAFGHLAIVLNKPPIVSGKSKEGFHFSDIVRSRPRLHCSDLVRVGTDTFFEDYMAKAFHRWLDKATLIRTKLEIKIAQGE